MHNTTPKDCWKRIGVQGDGSCPELAQQVHCRNCPVYSEAALHLLDRPLPQNHLREWTEHFAAASVYSSGGLRPSPSQGERIATISDRRYSAAASVATENLFIFRIAREWLGLSPLLFLEVLESRPVHSLPHRRKGVVLGLVNVRGGLIICISLAALLGLEPAQEEKKNTRSRLLVVSHGEYRFAFPADEVHGTHRYDPRTLEEVPATVAKATPSYTHRILGWGDKSVACLDQELLLAAFNRSLS